MKNVQHQLGMVSPMENLIKQWVFLSFLLMVVVASEQIKPKTNDVPRWSVSVTAIPRKSSGETMPHLPLHWEQQIHDFWKSTPAIPSKAPECCHLCPKRGWTLLSSFKDHKSCSYTVSFQMSPRLKVVKTQTFNWIHREIHKVVQMNLKITSDTKEKLDLLSE